MNHKFKGFSLVETLIVMTLMMVMVMSLVVYVRQDQVLEQAQQSLVWWLQGQVMKAERLNQSVTFDLVSSTSGAKLRTYPLKEELTLPSKVRLSSSVMSWVYRPMVHTVSPATTLTLFFKNRQAQIVISARGAILAQKIRR